jgi:hypothetical protein
LLHHPEAAELALDAVIVTMVVGVARDEAILADRVPNLEALDDVDRERELRDPRGAGAPIREIEPRRGRVPNPSLRSHVVDDRDEQVRLRPAHQVDVAHRVRRIAGELR